jgi:hypothetical protein
VTAEDVWALAAAVLVVVGAAGLFGPGAFLIGGGFIFIVLGFAGR